MSMKKNLFFRIQFEEKYAFCEVSSFPHLIQCLFLFISTYLAWIANNFYFFLQKGIYFQLFFNIHEMCYDTGRQSIYVRLFYEIRHFFTFINCFEARSSIHIFKKWWWWRRRIIKAVYEIISLFSYFIMSMS